jgi:hypothetical protein
MGAMRARVAVLGLVALLASAAYVHAQFGFRGFGFGVRMAPAEREDGDFAICRIMYESVRGARAPGAGWSTDYPLGETNLSIRVSELTRTRVSRDPFGQPNHWVVRLTDDELFDCPFTMASDVGTMFLSPVEADRLREYLLKGGFLWVDDFWGEDAWAYWAAEIGKALPPAEFPIEDIPVGDPIFSSQFDVEQFPQIPRLPYWISSGGDTSELGPETVVPHFRAIRDAEGRIMVVMTHNTDIADSWEREGEDPRYFYAFSPDGYAVGINVLLHAMTH